MPLKILIVDDHPLTHAGFKLLFQNKSEYEIVGFVENAANVIPFIQSEPVDVIFLDINLPDKLGISLLAELIGLSDMTVILLTGENRPADFEYALKMGIRAIISKSDPLHTTIKAIDRVRQGEVFISETIERQMGERIPSKVTLSPRQMAILHFISEGETNKEISYRLKISPPTVSFHINEICKKIGITNSRHILNQARDIGLL